MSFRFVAAGSDAPINMQRRRYALSRAVNLSLSVDERSSGARSEYVIDDAPLLRCLPGELGCRSRERDGNAGGACDAPYECCRGVCIVCSAVDGCAHNASECAPGCDYDAEGFGVPSSPTCRHGLVGCRCLRDAPRCVEAGAVCVLGRCVADNDACARGTLGCRCLDGGTCRVGVCDTRSLTCMAEPATTTTTTMTTTTMMMMMMMTECVVGEPGCACDVGGACSTSGHYCNEHMICVRGCIFGERGCDCTHETDCRDSEAMQCVDFGRRSLCVEQPQCGRQRDQRCLNECGPGNVVACGVCDYSQPVCRDAGVQYCNRWSPLFGLRPCRMEYLGSQDDTGGRNELLLIVTVIYMLILNALPLCVCMLVLSLFLRDPPSTVVDKTA